MTKDELDLALEAASKNSEQILKDWKLNTEKFESLTYDCFMFGVYWAEENLKK